MTLLQIPIGDYNSSSGHRLHETILVETSASFAEVCEAELVAEDKLPHELSPLKLCSVYGENFISREIQQEILTRSGIDLGLGPVRKSKKTKTVTVDPKKFVEYVVWMINTELPVEKHLRIVEIPILSQHQYGYGLFDG